MLGDALWYQVQQRNERAQPMMNLTTLTRRQPANHQQVGHLANIGCHGLTSCAKQWASILKYVHAAQE
jgi:hypothetical protein